VGGPIGIEEVSMQVEVVQVVLLMKIGTAL
jgi:hypothetical protein